MLLVTETSFALVRLCPIIVKKDGKPEIAGFPIFVAFRGNKRSLCGVFLFLYFLTIS